MTIQDHQNPEYYADPNTDDHVYVRVRNSICTNVDYGILTVYWAKASPSPYNYLQPWDGTVPGPPAMGGIVGTKTIYNVPGSGYTIYHLPWHVPNPEDYASFGADKGHFCLLARITIGSTAPYGMTYAEGPTLWLNVKNNNNIAWKNLEIVDINPYDRIAESDLLLHNINGICPNVRLTFSPEEAVVTHTFIEYGNVYLNLGPVLFNRLKSDSAALRAMKGFRIINDSLLRLVTPCATLQLRIDSSEIFGARLRFELPTRDDLPVREFNYAVNQYCGDDDNPSGGIGYCIRIPKPVRGNVVITKTIDLNGDGVYSASDYLPLPTGVIALIQVMKDSTLYEQDTLGNGVSTLSLSLPPGTYTFHEIPPVGWTPTNLQDRTLTITADGQYDTIRFLNFKQVTVCGTVYHDRNGNGVHDLAETGMSGVLVSLTGVGGGVTVCDANGSYCFNSVGPGSHTLTETAPSGWQITEPSSGSYTFSAVSGNNRSQDNFGNYHILDTLKYFTVTADSIAAHYSNLVVKVGQKGNPFPTYANMYQDLYKKAALAGNKTPVRVGLPSQMNASKKTKAYLAPGNGTEIPKSMLTKMSRGIILYHTNAARGFDIDEKGRQMLNRYKYIPPKIQNNVAIPNLLTLKFNIALSDYGVAPAGLG